MEKIKKTVEELERELAHALSEAAKAKAHAQSIGEENDTLREELKQALEHPEEKAILPDVTETWLNQVKTKVYQLRNMLLEKAVMPPITPVMRRRLLGSGVRRYGFIDKVSDVIAASSSEIPEVLDIPEFKELLRLLEIVRNNDAMLQQAVRVNRDFLLVMGNEAYRQSLVYYGFVREAAHRGIPGAQEIFDILRDFFRMPRRPGEEPTEREMEADFNALLHGRKDGRIEIENERPHTVGGKRVVVDETGKSRENIKIGETEQS